MNNHFWASRAAAAHRKEAHSSHPLFLATQPQQGQPGRLGHLSPQVPTETRQLHSCSTSCPPPRPDVQGTGHLEHPPYRAFLLHSHDEALKSLCMEDVSGKWIEMAKNIYLLGSLWEFLRGTRSCRARWCNWTTNKQFSFCPFPGTTIRAGLPQ